MKEDQAPISIVTWSGVQQISGPRYHRNTVIITYTDILPA
jgi:hypothetical protein